MRFIIHSLFKILGLGDIQVLRKPAIYCERPPHITSELLTSKHYELFGRIIVDTANAETGIRLLISDVVGCDEATILTLLAPHTSSQLRTLATAIANQFAQKEISERLKLTIEMLDKVTIIRNKIAHERWTKGTKTGSIKPTSTRVRKNPDDKKEKAKVQLVFTGALSSTKEYSIKDFQEFADNAETVNIDIVDLIKKIRHLPTQ